MSTKLPIGERLLPAVVDEYARYEPDKLIASIPESSNMDVWHDVTYRELARAVDNLSWFIESKVGRSESFETIGYMGTNDIRYTVFWLAAMKTGYCILNTSPRNSIEGQVSLLKETSCSKFFHAKEMSQKVGEMKSAQGGNFVTVEVPTYVQLITKQAEQYPFDKSYQELADRPAIIFHTSGSTGLPKPITLPHSFIATMDNVSVLPVPEGREPANWTVLRPGQKYFNAMPYFHAAGCVYNLYAPILCGIVFVLQPAEKPLNEVTFLSIVERLDLAAALLPPSFLDELSRSPGSFEQLAKLKYIWYGGGPLSFGAGERLSAATNIIQMIGGTEMGLVPGLISQRWQYFEWNPNYGLDMEQVGDADVYEMVVKRDSKLAKYHSVFKTFPDTNEWRTRDLFAQDATNPNRWLFVGRTDDVVVLSNGEKFSPLSMEAHIQDHPLLVAALVIGQGRFQVGLLVEPDYHKWDAKRDPQELVEEIWSVVQQANNFSAATGRIFKSQIMVAKSDKPFIRAGKGTILRAATIKEYDLEIDALYASVIQENVHALPEVINQETISTLVRDCLSTYLSCEQLSDTDDLFSLGLDSLQTMGFANAMRLAVEPALQKNVDTGSLLISPKTIYQNPSISKLALHITGLFNSVNNTNGSHGGDLAPEIQSCRIAEMVERHTVDLPHHRPSTQKGISVILTGTTGTLGTYLLQRLLTDPLVVKVYCFNRTSDSEQRTMKSLSQKGFAIKPGNLAKVKFLTVQFGQPDFGISGTDYAELVESVDLVIHNAWAVNFNHGLESFETPHIKGVRNLIDFSLKGTRRAHIFFVSSIGSIGNWAATQDGYRTKDLAAPEIPMRDPRSAVPQGYAESKYVAEQILVTAAEKSGVPISVARVGQIAGPTTELGKWNDAEWLPSIIKTSKSIGKLPSSLGAMAGSAIDWVPIDKVAAIIVELAFGRLVSQESEAVDIFHIVNPKLATWSELLPAVERYLRDDAIPVEVIDYGAWIESVRKTGGKNPSAADVDRLPVLVLLDFFQNLTQVTKAATTNTEAKSTTMAKLGPITQGLMANWLKQWAY